MVVSSSEVLPDCPVVSIHHGRNARKQIRRKAWIQASACAFRQPHHAVISVKDGGLHDGEFEFSKHSIAILHFLVLWEKRTLKHPSWMPTTLIKVLIIHGAPRRASTARLNAPF